MPSSWRGGLAARPSTAATTSAARRRSPPTRRAPPRASRSPSRSTGRRSPSSRGEAMRRRSVMPLLAGLAFSRRTEAQTPMWLPGLQLYTVRDALGADLDGTLRTIAEVGYREVELAGLPGVSAGVLREKLRQYGLAVPSIH